jgi:hypothetical protein
VENIPPSSSRRFFLPRRVVVPLQWLRVLGVVVVARRLKGGSFLTLPQTDGSLGVRNCLASAGFVRYVRGSQKKVQ